jgi:hypothetical protein
MSIENIFYLHQAVAIDAIREGHHVAISTSTASGKSITYNIPVLESILLDRESTALYLFPTKVPSYRNCMKLFVLVNYMDRHSHKISCDRLRNSRDQALSFLQKCASVMAIHP